jgi:HK97 family phage major capsid protein
MSVVKSDAMCSRLEKEIEERNAFIEGLVSAAQDAERDLTATEQELATEARKRIEECDRQLVTLYETRTSVTQARKRTDDVSNELYRMRGRVDSGVDVEYRSAGGFIVDTLAAFGGSREARERLEVFNRVAAHQRTDDNPGVIPDPIVGSVINFIDSARPLVSMLGVQPLPAGTFYRPKVTQHTLVSRQTDGGSAELTEKVELASRKMLLTRLTVNADTYGGYVNVSRQNIDWSSPQIFDIIVNDLAAQYAIATEEALADAIAGVATTAVDYPLAPTGDELSAAIWEAASAAYTASRGQGRLVIAIAPDRLSAFGPLFAPYGTGDKQGTGFTAGSFGQGVMGAISGIPVVMSSALDAGEAFLMSTAGVEVWEQRVGTLQVVEPSVLGVQVAYAGYFAALIAEAAAVIPLEEGTA